MSGWEREVTGRTALLAIHGPLVEFDRKLYTVGLTERRIEGMKTVPLLNLGSAVEVKPNVWYQAYSEEFSHGGMRVTEIKAEFASDPRREQQGKAKLQMIVRMHSEREGKRTEVDGEFRPAMNHRSTVIVWGKLNAIESMSVLLRLPHGEIPARFDTAPFRKLIATSEQVPNPRLFSAPADWVQPPSAKP